jgi:hypothetical protein
MRNDARIEALVLHNCGELRNASYRDSETRRCRVEIRSMIAADAKREFATALGNIRVLSCFGENLSGRESL